MHPSPKWMMKSVSGKSGYRCSSTSSCSTAAQWGQEEEEKGRRGASGEMQQGREGVEEGQQQVRHGGKGHRRCGGEPSHKGRWGEHRLKVRRCNSCMCRAAVPALLLSVHTTPTLCAPLCSHCRLALEPRHTINSRPQLACLALLPSLSHPSTFPCFPRTPPAPFPFPLLHTPLPGLPPNALLS